MSKEEILSWFYRTIVFRHGPQGWMAPFDPDHFKGKLTSDLRDARTGEVVLAAGERMTPRAARRLREAGLEDILVRDEELIGRYFASDLINEADRRGLFRGRRRDHRRSLGAAGRDRDRGIAGARHRPRHGRALHPQHARDRQERDPRGRADRHLPGHAPGRAADPGNRRGAVQQPVLRPRALRSCRRSAGSR